MVVATVGRSLVLVSNRLPASLVERSGECELRATSGGLASALSAVSSRADCRWIGHVGELDALDRATRSRVESELEARRWINVEIPPREYLAYYEGYSNSVLWPLLHYLVDKVELDSAKMWAAYQSVNERFARAVADVAPRGAAVWVHDYQLMLVPALLRALRPDVKIGFFLHVPFPTHEVFRVIPWREALLRGVLGADLLGFHTQSYQHHFSLTAAHVLDADVDHETLRFEGRAVRVGTYPISVDPARWIDGARRESVQARARELRASSAGRSIVLGVDRLDYTKGIPRRLLAIERFLERYPERRASMQFIQVAVPSRENVEAYADYRRVVDAIASRVNGTYGTPDRVPIHLLHKGVDFDELCALYLAADVMLVTPLRDGMNLVAKEYCAAQRGRSGALVLSEFAGAAEELSDAIIVNPYDVDSVASAIHEAISMPEPERAARMSLLTEAVERSPVSLWAERFVRDLEAEFVGEVTSGPKGSETPTIASRAASVLWVLDYDGTLVELQDVPERATADGSLRALLSALVDAGDVVHVVSGRPSRWLDAQLGSLPIALHAEHGALSRPRGSVAWKQHALSDDAWRLAARRIIAEVVGDVHGASVEEKTLGLAWHYRRALPEVVIERLGELRARLSALALGAGLSVLDGAKVIELRPRGASKGSALARIIADSGASQVVVMGDDVTDEDMFVVAPSSAVTVKVGRGESAAKTRLSTVAEVRAFLAARVEERRR
ncbi:MAG: bifunctional alpha,alpha-trehalose-phosphate synthase (UDP-forming)/trehalose-phosphatase [Polyangiales bacterium]